MDYEALIDSLQLKGCCCTETVVRFALAIKEEENELLANASAGLCGGLHAQKNCGALTGGALMLAMFVHLPELNALVKELTAWFDEKYGMMYGSIDCIDIAGENKEFKAQRCKPMIKDVCLKCVEMLKENGYIAE